MSRTYGRLMVEKTLAVVNSCTLPEHLEAAIRYVRLADLENNARVKIAIVSMAHQLSIKLENII